MHTREETLNRLAEIVKFVKKINQGQLNLNSWGGETECGTICCVMGWLTESKMYGLKWATVRFSYPAISSGIGFRSTSFEASRRVLFGAIEEWTEKAETIALIERREALLLRARTIAANLFGIQSDSDYDEQIAMDHKLRNLSHRKLFELRAKYAITDINNLYDEIEAENARVK